MSRFTESVVEDTVLGWLGSLGYAVLHGPDIATGEPAAERNNLNYRNVVLEGHFCQALVRLDPGLPAATSATQSDGRAERFCMEENKDEYTKQ